MINQQSSVKNILIVGGGTAGWITAALLAKQLSNQTKITLIESPERSTVGVGEATIPPIVNLLATLEIDEKAFIKSVQATFKYGIDFQDWHTVGQSYMHTFGKPGFNLARANFARTWLTYRQAANLAPLNHYSATALASKLNKFSPPHKLPLDASSEDFYPLSDLYYAYHFDASLLANFLKAYAKNLGVIHQQGTITQVSTHNSKIVDVRCADGTMLTADLFIDCSGARSLLAQQSLNVPFIDWSDTMPCDRAIAVQTKLNQAPEPYTKSIAMTNGWRWQIPLQKRLGNGYVYSSKHISDDDAERELLRHIGKPITKINRIKFKTGHLTQPWFSNVVAIGLSSGFFEPLESTSIHMIHKYADKLCHALLNQLDLSEAAKAFNASYEQDGRELKDFILLHYCLSQRDDSQFWRDCQAMALPESLVTKLKQYRQNGEIALSQGQIFPYESYVQILAGMQTFPDHPLEPEFDWSVDNATAFFSDVHHGIYDQVTNLPSHETYLDQFK